MGYKAVARGALLNKRAKSKTVVIECGDDGDVIVVLQSPPENLALKLFEQGQNEEISQQQLGAELVIAMAHSPQEKGGEPLNLGTETDMICVAADPMFVKETDLETILGLPVGHPMAMLRDEAAEFAGELVVGKKPKEEVVDGGTSESQNSSEEDSTSETSESGTNLE